MKWIMNATSTPSIYYFGPPPSRSPKRNPTRHPEHQHTLVVVLLNLISLQELQEGLSAVGNTGGCTDGISGGFGWLGRIEGGEFGSEVGGEGRCLRSGRGGV